MKPAVFKKLTAVQNARLTELTLLSSRIREKARDALNANIVRSRIEAINEIWAEARKSNNEIIAQDISVTDPYVNDGVFKRLQTTYEDTLDYLLIIAAEFDRGDDVASRRSVNDSSQNFTSRPAKLPKLDLPTFSGKYEDWDSFCDLFSSLVHNAPSVDDTTKLQYLKSCLTGPAADLVKDVATTSANYNSTWQALKSRFYNPRLTVTNHLNALMNLPHLKRESAPELRKFADESQRIVRALTNMKMPVEHWDAWLVFIVGGRLDSESRKLWESELSAKDRNIHTGPPFDDTDTRIRSCFPTFNDLASFLEKRAHALSMISIDKLDKGSNALNKQLPGARRVLHANISRPRKGSSSKCPLCSALHALVKCPTLIRKTPYERRLDIRHLRLCFNCFGYHNYSNCTSRGRCAKCGDKHHSLLHFEGNSRTRPNPPPPELASRDDKTDDCSAGINVNAVCTAIPKYPIILATAQVIITGPNGSQTRARALLDQGSEGSFMTEAIATLLELPRERVRIPLSVVGGNAAGIARSKTNFLIGSRLDASFKLEAEALILPKLTSHLPARNILEFDVGQFNDIPLADPQYYVPCSVDLILGADIYGLLLRSGLKTSPPSQLVAQNTALGWIISGPTGNASPRQAELNLNKRIKILHCAPADDLTNMLERFWKLEELPRTTSLKPDDALCEKQFADTYARSADGRFIVKLPTKGVLPEVGDETRRIALGSLKYMHRRFEKEPALAIAYREFMTAYEQLGHMTRVPKAECVNPRAWYLPHHAVSHGGKIRVVFDASRNTKNQHCLNDFLLSGPPLQKDLPLILLNWRRYRYVFTADIVKMFRQIRVLPSDRDMQRIVWAPNSRETPVEYYLNTVTYGTTCAPFLALRTLTQLACDEKSKFPLGARCLEKNAYVDDMFVGADELSLAVAKRKELTELLKSAGFELDKWAANNPEIIPLRRLQNEITGPKSIDRDDSVKTLGVHWHAVNDEFIFSASNLFNSTGNVTKRSILSNIARLFDPLGWLSPVTIKAKIMMQDLWILKSDWDSSLPVDIRERWAEYCNSLSNLSSLSIGRWLGTDRERLCQVHGFSDASSRAYAAAVYLRIAENNGSFRVCLLAAKTKVAPVKSVSIPNLELCGAALLTKLVCYLRSLDFFKNLPMFMWSDSEIVLKWLSKHPCHWKTFVANRVSLIHTELPAARWSHVSTKENPADIATRGATPLELRESSLWWDGPVWLSQPSENWPQPRETTTVMHVQPLVNEPDILTRFSSLTRLTRVVAYCLRPILNLRRRKQGMSQFRSALAASELTDARIRLIRIAQLHAFRPEIELLRAGKTLNKSNRLSKLNPFLNEQEGILRVGGRLAQANVSFNKKHPPILPRLSNLSRLFIRQAHMIALHGGPTLTASIVMQMVWIIGSMRLVKTAIRSCIKCQRVKPRLAHQLMGNLPASRVTPARPFTVTGVDYAGPFQIRTTKGRGHRAYKGYIALFICFVTRAIHLELVSDLTTASFIAAYRRFVNRRGTCKTLYSDNSTTFRGADTELRDMFNAASEFYASVAASIANDGTTWIFIPPTTPHYGGLWEAGIKSAKHHLKRAFGDLSLTFEEFSTVLTEIEACLNSRPLCPLTTDIDDLNALTPAHFLTGEASGFIPDQAPPELPENRLSRFQLMQRVRNTFWRRWSDEYLHHLQERGKWRKPIENFAIGQLVLLRDDRYPPTKWPLGRVIELHPGPDGHVRVVTVRTSTNTFKRHIARLAPLIIDREHEAQRRNDTSKEN